MMNKPYKFHSPHFVEDLFLSAISSCRGRLCINEYNLVSKNLARSANGTMWKVIGLRSLLSRLWL